MTENQPGGAGSQQASDVENNKDLKIPEGIDPDNASPEQVRELLSISQTALAQKRHWREKATDPETGKPYKELFTEAQSRNNITPPANPAPAAEQVTPEIVNTVEKLRIAEEKRQFGHSRSLTPEETDNVYAVALGLGIKPDQALDHPFVKQGLEAMRHQARITGATPGPSSRSPIVEGKSFNEMNEADKKKNFGKVVEGLSRK